MKGVDDDQHEYCVTGIIWVVVMISQIRRERGLRADTL